MKELQKKYEAKMKILRDDLELRRKVSGDVGRCGEMWGDVGGCRDDLELRRKAEILEIALSPHLTASHCISLICLHLPRV